jgi:hypothetical protein
MKRRESSHTAAPLTGRTSNVTSVISAPVNDGRSAGGELIRALS